MTRQIRRLVSVAVFGVSVAAAIVSAGQSAAVQTLRPMTLAVPGATSSAPSLATLDRTVVAVWPAALPGGAANVYIATSADAGATFSQPRRVNDQDGDASANNEQPPRAVIAGPAGARTITVVWSKRNEGPQRSRRDVVRVARSTDGGRSFSPARDMHPADLSGARGWESVASGRPGEIHAVWLDGREAERRIAETLAHTGIAHKGQPPQDVYHAVLTESGRTETVIANGVCFCCKTAVAVDARGTIYAAWRHIFPGSMRDIAFARSVDGGRRFEPLVRVSEDRWELNGCPEDGPTLAVDATGLIHIAWATLIDEGEPQKAVFYAISRDGRTFSPRARVPTAGITPGHPQMALLPDGGAALVWDETVNGLRRVSLSRVSADRRTFEPAQVLSGSESVSHPVIARSGAHLIVAWASRDEPVIRLHRLSVSR